MFVSALILYSEDTDRLARFYRDMLGLPLQYADHEGHNVPHFECELGDVHFAILPMDDRPGGPGFGKPAVTFALTVANLDQLLTQLEQIGINPLYPAVQRGFGKISAVVDPDGNLLELTELSQAWLDHLSNRLPHERDVAVFSRIARKNT
jgi:predicted enzyme related to lactoylglutathione lyase